VTLYGEIPVEATVRVVDRVVAIGDKGSSALIIIDHDAELLTGQPLWTTRMNLIVRGGGGWGGERGTSSPVVTPPAGDPDHIIEMPTTPSQAYMYRLNGDRNPLHSDPSFATAAGFEKPILHGLCTYAIATRGLINTMFGGDGSSIRHLESRFVSPVVPGEPLTVRAWCVDDGAIFLVSVGDRGVLDGGVLRTTTTRGNTPSVP
jgi:acyl dehydratase